MISPMSRIVLPGVIFLFALGIRLLYIWQIKDAPLVEVLLIDSNTYDGLAKRILEGRYQGEEIYAVNVLYPWFLAAVYSIFKIATLPVLVVQVVLDAVNCVLVLWLGKQLFNLRTGMLAGALAAIFGPMIFYSGALLTPTLITFLGLTVLVLLVQYRSSPKWYVALIVGLIVGLATLARGNNLLLLGAGFLYFASLNRSWKLILQPTAWMLVGAFGVMSFINVRNYLVERQFVPISANYAAFYIGHNDEATGLYVLPELIETASFEGEVWGMRDAVSEIVGRPLTLAESAQFLFQSGVKYALTNPGREIELVARKFYYFWNRTESPTNLNYHFAQDFSWLLRLLPLTFGIIAPLALFGMWLTRSEWRKYLQM